MTLKPLPIIIGVILQFLVMPALGFAFDVLFKLPSELAAGVVMVEACPGGTALDVIVYFSK